MRLTELDPEWITYGEHGGLRRHGDLHSHVEYHPDALGEVDAPENPPTDIAGADGVMFLCPACFKKNGGAIGTERVLVWFRGRNVPDDALPGPGRWNASGSSFDDLTLSPSVNVDHEHWHGFITNGEVR